MRWLGLFAAMWLGCGAAATTAELAPLPPDADADQRPPQATDDAEREPRWSDSEQRDIASLSDDLRALSRVASEAAGDCSVLAQQIAQFAEARGTEMTARARRLEAASAGDNELDKTLATTLAPELAAIERAMLACQHDEAVQAGLARLLAP